MKRAPHLPVGEEEQRALSYNLDIATTLPADKVARRLPVLAGDPEVTLGQLLAGVAVAEGTWLRVGRTEPRPGGVVESDLGFTPTVWVVFRLAKSDDITRQLDDVVRRTVDLLDEVPRRRGAALRLRGRLAGPPPPRR